MNNYLELFSNVEGVTLEELVMSFGDLMNELDKFWINERSFGNILSEDISNLSLTPDDIVQNKIRITYEDDNYYCNCSLGDILEMCLLLISRGRALRIDTVDDSKLYELLVNSFSYLFSDSQYSIVPAFLKNAIIIPSHFDITNEESIKLLNSIFWDRIERIIIPESVNSQDILKLVPVGNTIIQSKDKVNILKESLREELNGVDSSKVFDLDDVLSKFENELNSFSTNLAYFERGNSQLSAAYSSIIDPIEKRYELLIKMYNELEKIGNEKEYMIINWKTTNPYQLELLGSLCAVYSYFTGTKVLTDINQAGYQYFEKTLLEIVKGNNLSPYLSYKRYLNIKKEIDELKPSMFRSVLRKGGRINPVVSFPFNVKNEQPVYILPLNMFLSYSEDEKLKEVVTNNNSCILTLPRNKDIMINIRECVIDDIKSNESAKLKLRDDFGSNLPEGFTKDLCKDTMLNYLSSGDICFEGGDGKLVLHDWILNPSRESIEVISEYLNNIFAIPNSDSEIRDTDYSILLRKVLGFDSLSNFSSIYDTEEWNTGVTSSSSDFNGEIISKSRFSSYNYEKSEFYSSVCEIISSVLHNQEDNNSGYNYVTIHDLMLATAEVGGKTEVYIVYCPLNPEIMWYVCETGSISSYTLETDKLSGIPDSLINIGSERNEVLSHYLENLNTLINCDYEAVNYLKSDEDKLTACDYISKIENSEFSISEGANLMKLVTEIADSHNILEVKTYLSEKDIELYRKLCLWFISTKFVGFNSEIPNEYPTNGSTYSSEEYGITTLSYLYGDYYNVIGYENLNELESIISPEKHLKYCRIINPYGGVLRSGGILLAPEMNRVFCTTGGPGKSYKYQYTNSRFISDNN